MGNHSSRDWSYTTWERLMCVWAPADNDKIISTLSFFPPLCLFPNWAQAFLPLSWHTPLLLYYFAFVSDLLFLAPLPSVCLLQEREKQETKSKKSVSFKTVGEENRFWLFVVCYLLWFSAASSHFYLKGGYDVNSIIRRVIFCFALVVRSWLKCLEDNKEMSSACLHRMKKLGKMVKCFSNIQELICSDVAVISREIEERVFLLPWWNDRLCFYFGRKLRGMRMWGFCHVSTEALCCATHFPPEHGGGAVVVRVDSQSGGLTSYLS